MDNKEIANKMLQRINDATNILIIASKPIDNDSLGTSLSIKWWLEKLGKKVKIFAFSYIPESFRTFPSIEEITQNQLYKVDFNFFDLIILPDGNSFSQFFTNDYDNYSSGIDKKKLINIDHHEMGEISNDSEVLSLSIRESCTAKIFYDYFLADGSFQLDLKVATWMYYALVGDTGVFQFSMYKDTFEFADKLIKLGVDHYQIIAYDIDKKSMDFLGWAIEKSQYFPKAQATILEMDEATQKELNRLFGDNWDRQDLDRYYKNVFLRMVRGYPYGLIFTSRDNNTRTEVSFRSKNYGADIEIMKVLESCNFGFKGGGHKNSGGGQVELPIKNTIEKFLKKMVETISG